MKLLLILLAACAAKSDWVDEVRFVHGSDGPYALSGYRIGANALKTLGAKRGDFALKVVHRSPAKVQYTCMMDGLMAATGVSPGKMNIRHEVSTTVETLVTFNDRTVRYTLDDGFEARIKKVDYKDFAQSVELLRAMPDDQMLHAHVVSR